MKNKAIFLAFATYLFTMVISTILVIVGFLLLIVNNNVNYLFTLPLLIILDFSFFGLTKIFKLNVKPDGQKTEGVGLFGYLLYLTYLVSLKIRLFIKKKTKKDFYKNVENWIEEKKLKLNG